MHDAPINAVLWVFNYYKVNCGIDCYIIIIRPFISMQHSSLAVYLTQLSKYGSQLYVDTYSNFEIAMQEDAECH